MNHTDNPPAASIMSSGDVYVADVDGIAVLVHLLDDGSALMSFTLADGRQGRTEVRPMGSRRYGVDDVDMLAKSVVKLALLNESGDDVSSTISRKAVRVGPMVGSMYVEHGPPTWWLPRFEFTNGAAGRGVRFGWRETAIVIAAGRATVAEIEHALIPRLSIRRLLAGSSRKVQS